MVLMWAARSEVDLEKCITVLLIKRAFAHISITFLQLAFGALNVLFLGHFNDQLAELLRGFHVLEQ